MYPSLLNLYVYAFSLLITSLPDHRDPIQKFVEDKARPAGLWVDNPMQASDYIRTVPAVDQNPSLPGLTFKGPMRRAGDIGQEDTSSIDAKYLHLGKTEGAVDLGDALDYTSDTIWSFETDAYGKSLIYTKRIIQEKDRKRAVLWYLSTDGSNNAIVKQRPGADPEWKALLPSLQWEVEVLEPPKVDGKKNVLASKACIRRGNLDLGRTFDRGNKQPGGLVLVDVGKYEEAVKKYRLRDIMYRQGHGPRPELPGPAVPFYVWEVEMEAMGPGNLEYSSPKWVLTNKLKVNSTLLANVMYTIRKMLTHVDPTRMNAITRNSTMSRVMPCAGPSRPRSTPTALSSSRPRARTAVS